ncbi:MAG: hypothetical protein JWP12_3606 [Bacteroidetes bacterium]|nr:hypothetical protein [Bacteroidota bacterium]
MCAASAQEICGNGVDDDGDGLIDCMDPDCSGGTVPTGAKFNTATNGVGGVLPGGSNDNNWLISTGSLTGPYVPAIVMSSVPGSYYTSPWPDCNWISHDATGIHSVNTDFYYKTTFYLPCVNSCGASYSDSATFCLNMDFFSDNAIDEVYVNGHTESGYLPGIPVAGPYSYVGFSAAGGSSFSICRDWQPGLNELIIKISSGPAYEGFLAQNSISAPPVTGDPTILSPANNFTVCTTTPSVTFTSASSGGTWTASCGSCINSGSGAFNPATAGTGTYTVVYTITTPCLARDTSIIEVLPAAPNATINPQPAHCISDPAFNFTSATAGGTWSGTGITNTTNGTFNPAVSGAGTFTITHIFSGSCGDTATQTVTVHALPTPAFTSDVVSGCGTLDVHFNKTGSAACASVLYTFGDGDSATTASALHHYDAPGTYSVTIRCTDANGCVGTASTAAMINVYPVPTADYSMTPSSPVPENTSVHLTNTSSGATTYLWLFGDTLSGSGNFSTAVSPSHTYAHEGDYCILLIASNANGCTDSVQYCIIVEGESTIAVPNVFTPNGDLVNDLFLIHTVNIKDLSYIIYDRWGLEIAEHNGIAGGWNGQTKSGKLAPDGTYYYILKATGKDDELIERHGYLQLLSK